MDLTVTELKRIKDWLHVEESDHMKWWPLIQNKIVINSNVMGARLEHRSHKEKPYMIRIDTYKPRDWFAFNDKEYPKAWLRACDFLLKHDLLS